MIRLSPMPLIAIVKGIRPAEAEAVAAVIAGARFGASEAPLSSPEPYACRNGSRLSETLDWRGFSV